MDNEPSFLETRFPFKEVSKACIREKSTRQGHLSTLQQWWARRPLAICRAALFAALCARPDVISSSHELGGLLESIVPGDDSVTGKLMTFIARLARWEARNDKVLLDAANKFIMAGRERPPVVADTFAGGGSMPVEALRLGLDAIASDLNPVASTALRVAVEYLPGSGRRILGAYKALINLLEQRIEEATARLYSYKETSKPLAFFWCLTYTCPKCHFEAPLLRNHWLANKTRHIAVRLVASLEERRFRFEVYNPDSSTHQEAAAKGTVDRKGAVCPNCGHRVSTAWLSEQGRSRHIGEQLYAKLCINEAGERSYRPVTTDDEQLARTCALRPIRNRRKNSLPTESFSANGIRHTWMMRYGIATTADLFNHRQGIALLEVLHELQILKEHLIRGDLGYEARDTAALAILLGLTLNRLISYGTRHCWWQPNGEFPASMFTRQAIPMVWNYVEIPINSVGAAGWKSAASWIERVVDHLSQLPKPATVWTGDAAHCSQLDDGSVDVVAIDPPYYDSVGYSYLADIYYVWMRTYLGDLFPKEFSGALSPKSEEAIVDRKHKLAPNSKGRRHFQTKMTQSLAEVRRILRPDGQLILMYGHKKIEAWEAILSATTDAGFQPVASWPINTERKSKFQHGHIDALSSSCLMVFRPGTCTAEELVSWEEFAARLRIVLKSVITELQSASLLGSDLVTALVAPTCRLFQTCEVIVEKDSRLSIGQLLERLPALARECELEVIEAQLEGYPDIAKVVWDLSVPVDGERSWMQMAARHPIVETAVKFATLLYEKNTKEADVVWEELAQDTKDATCLFLRAAALLSPGDSLDRQLANASLGRISQKRR